MTAPRPEPPASTTATDYASAPADSWRAFTLKGPWDFPIVVDPGPPAGLGDPGPKTIENRGFMTHWRGPVLVHTGRGWDPFGANDPVMRAFWRRVMGTAPLVRATWERWAGHIVGVATLTDCHKARRCCQPWGHTSVARNHHLVLADVRPLVDLAALARAAGDLNPPPQLRQHGMQQLWKPDPSTIERIRPFIPAARHG